MVGGPNTAATPAAVCTTTAAAAAAGYFTKLNLFISLDSVATAHGEDEAGTHHEAKLHPPSCRYAYHTRIISYQVHCAKHD